jgi:hypothetical protein
MEQGEPTIDWGELGELRALHEAVAGNLATGSSDRYGRPTPESAQRLAEVRWQGVIEGVTALDIDQHEVQLKLPPLPEPLKLRFLLDYTERPENWKPNQNVEFIGRFEVKNPHEIIVLIRLPE